MKRIFITSCLITSLALLGTGCSSNQEAGSTYDSTIDSANASETEKGVNCKTVISTQEGDSLDLKKFCTYNGKSDDSIVVSPSTASIKKVGKQSVDITVTDPEGIIYYYTININVTAKPTPTPEPTPTPTPTPETTPEPTPEPTPEDTPDTSSKSNYSRNNYSNSQQQAQQQQEPAPAPQQPQQSSGQQTTGEDDKVSVKKKASGGAASGSTYDSVAACDAAAATTQSHTCTFNAELQKYVLTYQ